MSFRATVLTLYPEMFPGPLAYSLAGTALKNETWTIDTVNLRDFGLGKHRQVDDTPAGGGPGMVLKADVLARALDQTMDGDDARPRILLSPRGTPLTQKRVRQLSESEGMIAICGRFEGVDERVIEARNLEEISVGDYILSGGEPAAIAMLDAVVRLLPGVMGNRESGSHESFESGYLEYPQFTRPKVFEGQEIPEVLLSGDHGQITRWRREKALELTRRRRPDLLEKGSKKESF